jgi:hypothetical protein
MRLVFALKSVRMKARYSVNAIVLIGSIKPYGCCKHQTRQCSRVGKGHAGLALSSAPVLLVQA